MAVVGVVISFVDVSVSSISIAVEPAMFGCDCGGKLDWIGLSWMMDVRGCLCTECI